MIFKSFKSFVEAFDNPYKFEPYSVTKSDKQYGFETSEGIYYIVSMLKNKDQGKTATIVAFETEQGHMGMTGSGDAFKVMATVIDIMKKEISFLKSSDIIHFEADDGDRGRKKLYKRLGKVLAKEVGKKLFVAQGGTDKVYIITQSQQDVDKFLENK